jgi:oligoendopeptidase F
MTEKETLFQLSRWSLRDLFPSADSAELKEAFARLEELVGAFEKRRAALKPGMAREDFLETIRELEEISLLLQRIGGFAELWFTEDTQNQAAQTLVARVEQLSAEVSNRILFFTLWWKALDNPDAQTLMADSGDYRYWLEEMRHFKPYTLSEPEEKIINIKDVTGSRALTMLYDAFTNRYTFRLKVGDEEEDLTRGELMTHVRSSDPDLRARAYQELYRVFGEDGPILGQMYQTLVRDWRNELIDLRGYQTPISARNLYNDIPDDVVDTLLRVGQENATIFQRFFRLKAKLLNMEKLRRYDVYAPVSASTREFEFKPAAEMVVDSFRRFDDQFADLALKVFREERIDSEVRKGKRSGAFCATINPQLAPWVMVNFQGRSDDVATLAHELGHAIHSLMASHHSIFTQHACLPLAETASTFAEIMLVDRLLEEVTDASVRRDLLFRQVDDAYATIMRQTFFALFEKTAHEMTREGASVDELSGAYMENLHAQFGDTVEIGDEFRWEWVSIPHIFHTPFYVYAYAFGQLLVLSLYSQYRQEGDSFKPRYKEILSSGGSRPPIEILSGAGIDVRQAAFWQGGFDLISGLISQLETLDG